LGDPGQFSGTLIGDRKNLFHRRRHGVRLSIACSASYCGRRYNSLPTFLLTLN
jgi:hypothetical protein